MYDNGTKQVKGLYMPYGILLQWTQEGTIEEIWGFKATLLLELRNYIVLPFCKIFTGKSFSEGLILESTNPQYDKRLFNELPVQHMKTTSTEHGHNMARTCSARVLS